MPVQAIIWKLLALLRNKSNLDSEINHLNMFCLARFNSKISSIILATDFTKITTTILYFISLKRLFQISFCLSLSSILSSVIRQNYPIIFHRLNKTDVIEISKVERKCKYQCDYKMEAKLTKNSHLVRLIWKIVSHIRIVYTRFMSVNIHKIRPKYFEWPYRIHSSLRIVINSARVKISGRRFCQIGPKMHTILVSSILFSPVIVVVA